MLPILQWFDDNPLRYWWFVVLILSTVAFIVFRPLLPGTQTQLQDAKSDWKWGWVILAVLVVGRWPTFAIKFELNPDESQLLAGALTLRRDPVFWRSVDTDTAGPLDVYALLPAGTLLGGDNFLTARLTALFLMSATLLLIHQSAALLTGHLSARMGGLATLCFEALTTRGNFLHYSTELVPICLLAAALYCRVSIVVGKKINYFKIFLTGFLLGAVPFAKLQAAPIAAALGVMIIFFDFVSPHLRLGHRWSILVAGAVSPALLIGVLIFNAGELENATICYLLNNVYYIGSGGYTYTTSLTELLAKMAPHEGLFPAFILGSAFVFSVLLVKPEKLPADIKQFYSLSLVALAVALVCVAFPKRPALHYLQLLVVPWTLLVSLATGVGFAVYRNSKRTIARIAVAALVTVGSFSVVIARSFFDLPFIGILAASYSQPYGSVAREVLRYTHPGDTLAVWGWLPTCFVETGLTQATLRSVTATEIIPGPYLEFFRDRYMIDLKRSNPAVFVDAVGNPNTLFPERAGAAHDEVFPELQNYVRDRYVKVGEVDRSRIYVRNDRLSARPSIPSASPGNKDP